MIMIYTGGGEGVVMEGREGICKGSGEEEGH